MRKKKNTLAFLGLVKLSEAFHKDLEKEEGMGRYLSDYEFDNMIEDTKTDLETDYQGEELLSVIPDMASTLLTDPDVREYLERQGYARLMALEYLQGLLC